MQCLITRKLHLLKPTSLFLSLGQVQSSQKINNDLSSRCEEWVLCFKVTLQDLPLSHSLSLPLPGCFARLLSPSSCFFSPFRTLSTFLLPGLCQVRSWSNAVTPGNWRRAEQYCPFAAGSREQEERRRWPALQHWQQGRDASGRAGMVPGALLGRLWLCIARPLQEWGNFAWYPWQALTFYSLKCSPWRSLGAGGVKQLCAAVNASNYQL